MMKPKTETEFVNEQSRGIVSGDARMWSSGDAAIVVTHAKWSHKPGRRRPCREDDSKESETFRGVEIQTYKHT